jgi:hypothetical protein
VLPPPEEAASRARPMSPSTRLRGLDVEGASMSKHASSAPTNDKVLRI